MERKEIFFHKLQSDGFLPIIFYSRLEIWISGVYTWRMKIDNYGTWLEIDLSTLRKNYQLLSELSKSKVMPIVKANAYGHGFERVAVALEKAGAEWFGVARIEEALMLRELGIKAKILVVGYTPPARVSHAIKEKISLTVYDLSVAEAYASHAQRLQQAVNLHVKIDTGMGRLGVLANKAISFVEYIKNQESLMLEGVLTHFACADDPEKNVTAKQINQFKVVLRELESKNLLPEIVHAANSAGTINFPETRFNLIRAGIALYGHSPSAQMKLPDGIASTISWKTRLISVKELPSGYGVSYGHTYHTKSKERIGVIAVGYGDGLRRRSGNFVLIRGKRVAIIGNVCMDQCMVNLDEIPDAAIGDEVSIIGKQMGAEISATDIANCWGTINYEVLCGLAARMPRYYLNT
jgi:alanine racemase